MIALLTGVIPNIARLILSPIWGHLFDRMNFFTLRVTLNCGFAIGIFTFFVSNSFWGLVLGAIIFGISNAGGDVAWEFVGDLDEHRRGVDHRRVVVRGFEAHHCLPSSEVCPHRRTRLGG